MRYLHLLGYRVIGLRRALGEMAAGIPMGRKTVVLTFDDGYQNFHDFALPVLKRFGFPATVFAVAGLLGRNARWLADDGRHAPPLMAAKTLRELPSQGISIGSHTLSHPHLTRIDACRQRHEIGQSKAVLERLLGEPIEFFCYPSGDFNDQVVKQVREAGYRAALTCIRGSFSDGDDPLLLPRKAVSYGDSLLGFIWKLHMKHQKKVGRSRS